MNKPPGRVQNKSETGQKHQKGNSFGGSSIHAFSKIDSFTIESRIMTRIVMAARIPRARIPRGIRADAFRLEGHSRCFQVMSQYYFVLQSLHRAFPSTTLYYKACTKHVPVLLCTTKLAQGMSQYYFVLQSLHKAPPSTTLY